MNGHLKYMPSSTGWAPCPFCYGKYIPYLYPLGQKIQINSPNANFPVMILNVIFLISYRILKVLFTFYWKQTKIHMLGHITHMSVLQHASFNNIWLQGKRKQGKSHSSSFVFKISMNKYSNHWHFII
jgi:hypothetical protein